MFKFVIFLSLLFVAGVFCQADDDNDDDQSLPPINNRDAIPTASGFPCPRGWKYFSSEGICLLSTPKLTRPAAEQFCVNLGGHLMAVHGLHSLNNAKILLGATDIWIGLNKDNSDDQWKNSNNETVNFLDFAWNDNFKCAYANDLTIYTNKDCNVALLSGVCEVYAST